MSKTSSWATVTARCSWVAFLLILGANMVGSVTGLKAIADFIALPTALCGILCGIVSLCALRQFERKGILVPAIVGILLNGLILAIWIPNFISAYQRAKARRGQQTWCIPVRQRHGVRASPANKRRARRSVSQSQEAEC